MAFTKQHFKAIAEIIKKNNSKNYNLINDFCTYFLSENPNFDEHRFKQAIMGDN